MLKPRQASASRDALVAEFLRYLAVERNSPPRTLKAYESALGKVREQLQMKPWLKCQADDFRDYLFHLSKEKAARSYIRLQFSALRTFYKFLRARKKLTSDPSAQVQLPKLQRQLPIVLTRQQIEELLSAPLRAKKESAAPTWMPLRDAAVLELFYSSGLCLAELASLNVADIDIFTASVRILG